MFYLGFRGKKYIDFSYMGVGTNLLGYSNSKVNKEVTNIINKGNCSTLNSREDIDLAKKIINLHPWFDAVRYGRGGADTNSIAIRLARSLIKKIKLQFVDIMVGMIGIYLQITKQKAWIIFYLKIFN